MIRILIFILSAVVVAGAITFLFGVDGLVQMEAFGQKIAMHAGFALGFVILALVIAIFATMWVKDLLALPAKIEARDREARHMRGIEAVTRGLEAVAVGDAADAQHHARIARRNLDESSLTRLLTAQAAQLSGDEAAASQNFTAMLDAPETEFLGLRGLYAQALRAGDKAAARGYAERAFRLRPNAGWAFESVLELGLERGAWSETRDAISMAAKNGLMPADRARRAEAALLTANAYAAAISGDTKLSIDEAEAAYKLAPGLAPAAVLAARLHAAAGRRSRAAKILEQAFAEAPHPALVKTHAELYAKESAERRAERMKRLADRRPTAREAKLALVRRHLILGEYTQAISALEPLLLETAYAGDYALMAEALAGGKRPDEADAVSQAWLRRAALARRDPAPGADGEFHFTREGWARLVREYMEHGRLAPPPIEDAPPGLSQDDMRLLIAPPIVADAGAGRLSSAPHTEESAMRPAARLVDDPGLIEGDLEELDSEAARAIAAAGKVS
jgi:HemY protein